MYFKQSLLLDVIKIIFKKVRHLFYLKTNTHFIHTGFVTIQRRINAQLHIGFFLEKQYVHIYKCIIWNTWTYNIVTKESIKQILQVIYFSKVEKYILFQCCISIKNKFCQNKKKLNEFGLKYFPLMYIKFLLFLIDLKNLAEKVCCFKFINLYFFNYLLIF